MGASDVLYRCKKCGTFTDQCRLGYWKPCVECGHDAFEKLLYVDWLNEVKRKLDDLARKANKDFWLP